jgi:hypothetical protein
LFLFESNDGKQPVPVHHPSPSPFPSSFLLLSRVTRLLRLFPLPHFANESVSSAVFTGSLTIQDNEETNATKYRVGGMREANDNLLQYKANSNRNEYFAQLSHIPSNSTNYVSLLYHRLSYVNNVRIMRSY